MLTRAFTAFATVFILATTLQSAEPAPTQAERQFEVQFMTDMIDHHAMAVMMADQCLERAVHPELRELCHRMRETQMEEIVQLQVWLEEWYGVSHDPQMKKGAQKQMQKLGQLSGEEFEIEFMKGMIKHHWAAVIAARHCQDKAHHQELVELCEDIEAVQTAEIELLGAWLCDWYDVCNFHGSAS